MHIIQFHQMRVAGGFFFLFFFLSHHLKAKRVWSQAVMIPATGRFCQVPVHV